MLTNITSFEQLDPDRYLRYPIYPKYWDRQARPNSVDQTPQTVISDQGLHWTQLFKANDIVS